MNIKNYWYPVVIAKKLKRTKPIAFRLFNQPLVIYRDSKDKIICLEDRCPHRGAPLSLGRIVNGQLECAYHGWRFAEGGKCTLIPTNMNETISPRCHASNKLVTEQKGVIWVWIGETQSETKPMFPNFLFPNDNEGYLYRLSSWDIPVAQDLFLENLFDLSHLPFVHHATLSRRSKAQPITFKMDDNSDAEFSAVAHYHKFQRSRFEETYKFIAPYLAQYDFDDLKSGKKIITQFFCTPIDRQHTRIFNYTFMKLPLFLFKLINNPITLALGKPIAKLITKQDNLVLQGQYQNRERNVDLANCPQISDKLVLLYRKWANQYLQTDYWFKQYETTQEQVEIDKVEL